MTQKNPNLTFENIWFSFFLSLSASFLISAAEESPALAPPWVLSGLAPLPPSLLSAPLGWGCSSLPPCFLLLGGDWSASFPGFLFLGGDWSESLSRRFFLGGGWSESLPCLVFLGGDWSESCLCLLAGDWSKSLSCLFSGTGGSMGANLDRLWVGFCPRLRLSTVILRGGELSASLAWRFRLRGDWSKSEPCPFFLGLGASASESCSIFLRGEASEPESCRFFLGGEASESESCRIFLGGEASESESCRFFLGSEVSESESCRRRRLLFAPPSGFFPDVITP